MRSPQRVWEFCSKLAGLWSRVPDLRLMQLITNCQEYNASDMFYVEDDEFLERLESYINDITWDDRL